MRKLFFILLTILFLNVFAQEEYGDYDDEEEEDPLSIGGGTQQTCDGCRTVMDQLLQEWHTIDNQSFLEAIEEASHKNEYVPVVPEEEEKRKEFEAMVVRRFMKRCKNVDIWKEYKTYIRKSCEEIVEKSGTDIAHILVDKHKEVDTDIMNYLTRVVCMGFNRLCNIKYLNLDARSDNTNCENCINIARLLAYQTRRTSRRYISKGFYFDNLLESVCETIPFYYSSPSEIGTLCEDLVSKYDYKIIPLLQAYSDGQKDTVEEDLCVKMSHVCSKREFKRIQNYNYRYAASDYQEQQNIRSMSMDQMQHEMEDDL